MPATRRPHGRRGRALDANETLKGLAELLAERPDLHGIGLAPLGSAIVGAEPGAWGRPS